jgi:hypothetical protein
MFVIDFGDFYDPHDEAHHHEDDSEDDFNEEAAAMDYQLRDDYSDVYDYDAWVDEQYERMAREGVPRTPAGARLAAAAQQRQQHDEASTSAAGVQGDPHVHAAAGAAVEVGAVAAPQQQGAQTPQQRARQEPARRQWCSPTYCGDNDWEV